MSHQISPQHPAVVLRSHYQQLRALFTAAMIAVVGLTVAVVILATSEGDSARVTAAPALVAPAPSSTDTVNPPGLRYDGGPDEGTRGPQAAQADQGTRYDGGPDEGTRGAGR
jgi:hypothetical protein